MRSKLLSLFILILLAGSLLPAGLVPQAFAAGPPWYVRGDFNGWGTDLMYDDGTNGDDLAGDNIYTVILTIATAGRYEFKVDDGNWTDPYPPNNAWLVTTVPDQAVKLTFDTNTYADGWVPTHNIVNAQDGVTAWTAVGDWQGWNPSNPATAMVDIDGGFYAYTAAIPTAGAHQIKVCNTGVWDAVGPEGASGGRSINTANLPFTTTVANQPVRFVLDTNTGRIHVQYPTDIVLINELDADQVGTDAAEFIELYDGGVGNTSLDGLVIVLYTGSDDTSYNAFDLDGWTTNAAGYFVLCGDAANVPNCDLDVTPNTNLIQNGQDAAALYAGDEAGFPNGTPVTTTNLIDAIVYDTDDPDDPELLTLLNPGQPQVNENSRGSGVTDSNQRCPNGAGGLRNTETYTQTPPTAGAPNACPTVDAAITKTGPGYVSSSGEDIDYVLTYEMASNLDGLNIVVTDTLPMSVTYVAFESILPVTLTNTDPVVFDAGSLAGLGVNVITLTVNVPAGLPFGTVLTNTVDVICDGDANLDNNQDVFTSTVVGSEISIDKAGPDLVLPGETIAYTLGYQVMGDPAEGVLITDTLPADVTYISDTAPVVPTEPTPGTLVWSMGTVTDSGSFVVYGLVSADPLTYTLHNEAWIYAANDTDPNNNDDFVDTAVPMPIYEIQHVDVITGTSPSPYLDEHVYTIGVVDAVYPPSGSYQRFAIVDPSGNGPWQGLYVYGATSMIPTVEFGDLLVLGGVVAEYYGFTELGTIDYYELLAAGHPVPDPVLTTTAAISTVNPQTAEPLEGVLVEVHCAEVTRLAGGYGEWGITDASGEEAQVDDTGDYTYVPVLGDVLTVRGVLFYSFDQFEIEPRGDGDILMTPLLTDHGPVDGDVPIGADIWATFNLTLSAATVNTATFFLEGPAGLVPGAVSYDGGTWTATLDPDADLAYDTTYTATLTTGIESLEGVAVCADYLWTFTTEEEPGPDLRPSSKTADRGVVEPGSTLTYTILLNNTGELTASAVLTDVVPAEVTVLTPTLPPGMVYDGGLLLWSGEVYPGQPPIELPFQVEVGAGVPSGTTIVNEVWIDDGVHLFTKSVSVQVLTCVPVSNPAFTWLPANPVVGQVITFTGTADGWAPITYTWSFGDGATGMGATVQHTYAMSDTYTVVMTATNACGELAISHMVVVVEELQPAWKVYLPIVVRGWGQ